LSIAMKSSHGLRSSTASDSSNPLTSGKALRRTHRHHNQKRSAASPLSHLLISCPQYNDPEATRLWGLVLCKTLEYLPKVQAVICCGRDSNNSAEGLRELLHAAELDIAVADGGPHPEAMLRRDRCSSRCWQYLLKLLCCVL
jgi:hypothetical protein